jgi:hypothetical protein
MKGPGHIPGDIAAQMSTCLDPLWDGFLCNAAFAIAERAHVSTGITPDALAQLPRPKLPAFFYRLGVDVRRVTIPLFNVDLGLFNRIADQNVTSLRVALLADGTLMQQRVSLAGAWDAYQYDVLALHHVLAKEYVYGSKVAALDNDSYFTHTTYSLFRQIDREVPETTVIEHETLSVLGRAHELGMREWRLSVSAISYDNSNVDVRQQFRGCTLEGLSCGAICVHVPVSPVGMSGYASKGPRALTSAVISFTRDDHLAPSAAETQEILNRRGSIPRNVINSRKASSFLRAW